MIPEKKTFFAVNAIWWLGTIAIAADKICPTDYFKCDSGQCIRNEYLCDGYGHCRDKSDENERRCAEKICSEVDFQCDSGQCIPNQNHCDGYEHCRDKSDENERRCADKICSTDEFQCDSGQCIPKEYRCNVANNCPDASDESERGCADKICSTDEFQCDSGQCIPKEYRCNVANNCPDSSDESERGCADRICSTDEFQCDSGQCIPKEYRCNVANNCPDSSDESERGCADKICSTDEFQCDSGQCIPKEYRCNVANDCPDSSDESERGCADKICSTDEFQCDSGQCIPKEYRCNVTNNCPDASDESERGCADKICSTDEFQCDSGQCIRKEYHCNSELDCPDASDERERGCADKICSTDEFQCDSGQCIRKEYRCNAENDCPDASDERERGCADKICSTDEFQCDSGQCIRKEYRCDAENDCPDASDESERGCADRICSTDEFQCDSGQCIPKEYRCNVANNCPDSSDESERGCADKICSTDEFRCDSGQCIPKTFLCNFDKFCPDASDESERECADKICSTDEFQCDSGQCIPKEYRCNMEKDCLDSSDESERGCADKICSTDEFQCDSGQCIPKLFRCDTKNHCPDASDESQRLCFDLANKICSTDEFQCDSGQCIPNDHYNCFDASDDSPRVYVTDITYEVPAMYCGGTILNDGPKIAKVCSHPSCANGDRQAKSKNECMCECAKGFRGNSCEIDVTTENTYQKITPNQGQDTTEMTRDVTTENSYQEITPIQGQDTTKMTRVNCYQKLGLTHGDNSALRLNSSSEDSIYSLSRIGLYDRGWCASSRDQNPFVQVDLLLATRVEGLRVNNTFLFKNGEKRELKKTVGVREFFVSYENDEEVFLKYKDENYVDDKVFVLDDSSYTKTILFDRPFFSRYVRIDILRVWDRPCLRLEIIGCRESVDYRCKPNSVHRGWAAHVKGFVQASKLDVLGIKSLERCSAEAKARNAVAFRYTNVPMQCTVLVSNMTTLTWIEKKDYMLQICATVVSSLEKWIVSGIDYPSIFASYGYPFSYNPYDRMTWNVKTDTNIYPDTYFIDISLNLGDTIHMKQTSSMSTVYGLSGDSVINSSMNGHQIRLLSSFHKVIIIFVTRSYRNIDGRNIRGFIAFVTSSRYRRYIKAIDEFDYTPGLVISESLLYEPRLSTPWMDVITFDNAAPCDCILNLDLIYLDVVCGSSELIVERSNYFWKSTESWCNLNRPLKNESRRIMPRANLKITFRPHSINDQSRTEGFVLKYVYDHYTHQCITVKSGDYNMTQKLCLSMEFNQTKLTWSEADQTCRRKHDGRLASLHTKEDFRIAQQLVYFSTAYFHMYNSLSRVVYIGFRRNLDGELKGYARHFTWLDGRPLVYSAWGGGFPKPLSRWDCAVLNGEHFDENAYIENTLCTARVTEMFICETKSSSTNGGQQKLNLQFHPIYEIGLDSSHLWKCKSGEFIVLTYHCDGIPDCIDRSDEGDCIYTAHENSNCPDHGFQCSDRTCISSSQFCDYITDCKDASDESCDYRKCGHDEFPCNNGQCILKEEFCNAEKNCFDGSDERLCHECSGEGKTTFRCNNLKCISVERVCDGFYDCPDMDDEKQCTTEAKSCQDWWKNTKRLTGVYAVLFENSSSPVNVECSFNHLNANVLLSTVYDVDYVKVDVVSNNYIYKLIYPTKEPEVFRYSVNKGRTCTQSVYLDCNEPKQKIADMTGKFLYPECICWKWTVTTSISFDNKMSFREIEGTCPGSSLESLDKIYHVIYGFLRHGVKKITQFRWVQIYFLIQPSYSQQRITVGPLACNETFYPDDGIMPCDKGHPVSNKTRCLYDEDRFGSPIGCADMSHTRHCETFICPENFVKCTGSYCLAVRFMCDGLQQCPNGEDEAGCGSQGRECPGYFRCNKSNICLPPSQVCDGFKHCHAGDDEMFCNISCPGTCICQGTFVDCRDGRINATEIVLLSTQSRKIFFSNSTIGNITVPLKLPMAFLVNLSNSGVIDIQPRIFDPMKNLRTLDISHNTLIVLRENTFKGLVRLRELVLHSNKYLKIIEKGAFRGLENTEEINMAHLHISFLKRGTFEGLKNIKKLDLRFNEISLVENRAFYGLENLESLLISYNEIKLFESEIFDGLTSLRYLETDDDELCCLKPSSVNDANCRLSQKYEFYSCEHLLQAESLGVLIWIIGILSLTGNLASFIYRAWKLGMKLKMGYGMFVTNLMVSDILMGIYLLVIAAKTFDSSKECWRRSVYCRVAGVLSTLSSQASIFFVMLITLDRILVVKFPFGQMKLTPNVCKVVAFLAWLIAIALSLLPLGLNVFFQGKFYSRTSIWLLLPLAKDNAPGWKYLLALFITLNLLLFFLIAFGQLLIFKEMRAKSPMLEKQKRSRAQTLIVARNLLMVVFANFLCWFPIGVIGILALLNCTIPWDMYAWASVVILPLNSVLNPILYTLSAAIKTEKFVPTSCEQDFISKEDIRRLDEVFGFDVLYTNDFRKLISVSTCIEKRTLDLNQIDLITTRIAERVDFMHKGMMYYGNLKTDNIWIFLDENEIKDIWIQDKPKRAVNKQMQSADIQFLESVHGALLKSYGQLGLEHEEQE